MTATMTRTTTTGADVFATMQSRAQVSSSDGGNGNGEHSSGKGGTVITETTPDDDGGGGWLTGIGGLWAPLVVQVVLMVSL